jgi:hypothetical protein
MVVRLERDSRLRLVPAVELHEAEGGDEERATLFE